MHPLEFITSSPQYGNANIANRVLAVPSEITINFEMYSFYIHQWLISHLLTSDGANKEENCKYMRI